MVRRQPCGLLHWIREDRTQQGKCFVFSSSIRSQRSKAASVGGHLAMSPVGTLNDLPTGADNVRCSG